MITLTIQLLSSLKRTGLTLRRAIERRRRSRRLRRELAQLDDRILRDIGITREEAERGILDRR